MTLPPRLAEIRDQMAKDVIHNAKAITSDNVAVNYAGLSFIDGFDACYAIMLKEVEPLVEALEFYADLDNPGIVAKNALSKLKADLNE